MNGPEHYVAAEKLLERSENASTFQGADNFAAQAQVHATLALAAATLETTTSPTAGGWTEAVLGR